MVIVDIFGKNTYIKMVDFNKKIHNTDKFRSAAIFF